MENPEIYVQRLFLERYALALRKIATGSEPTPDFEVVDASSRELVLEVKNLTSFDEPRLRVDFTDEEAMRGCVRDDNGPGRVGAFIHAGVKQLGSSACPKVLVIVNDDVCVDVFDLDAAYRGYLSYNMSDGRLIADRSPARVANGRIRDSKRVIDLFVWIDSWNESVSFRFRGRAGREVAERYFRYATQPQIGSAAAGT